MAFILVETSEAPIPLWIHQILKPPKTETEYTEENEPEDEENEFQQIVQDEREEI